MIFLWYALYKSTFHLLTLVTYLPVGSVKRYATKLQNFANTWLSFKTFTVALSSKWRSHRTSNASLHYLVQC